MTSEEILKFEESLEEISAKAKAMGLDCYPMRFEVCSAEIIYTFGAYGMPTRFSHWSFGKSFHKMKTQYDYNLSRIYELVINSNPCYAFLLDDNSLVQNKMVAAHVFAHCDFFKNNMWFRHTSKKMLETMARSAERISEYEFRYGRKKVEEVIDAAMSIQEHIEPRHSIGRAKENNKRIMSNNRHKDTQIKETPYDDLWNIGLDNIDEEVTQFRKFPETPEKDVLKFIATNSKELDEWECDIVFIIREEMLYFWPQIETKIMNEGWATLWHARIIRSMELTGDETLEFAKMHAGVIQSSKMGLNPYLVGLRIWEDIEKRWENPSLEEQKKYGRKGGEGKAKIFEVRETENDESFIRNYLTKDLVEELDLYLFQKVYTKWQVVDTEWKKVREGLVSLLNNGGYPYIVVEDGNYNRNGELYLKHCHEERDLDLYYLEKTLPYVFRLWGKNVYLETIAEDKSVLYSYNGEKLQKKVI